MKRVLSLFFMLLPLLASAQPDTLWTRVIDTPERDEARAAVETSDGGFMVAGLYEPNGIISDRVHLVRLTAEGDTLFTRILPAEISGIGWVESMTSDGGDGFLIVCGYGHDLIKINSAGDTIWVRQMSEFYSDGSGGPVHTGPRCIASAPNGSCLLAGTYWFGSQWGPHAAPVLERRDSIGSSLWIHSEAVDGIRLFDTGHYLSAYPWNGVTVSAFSANGAVLWTREHNIHTDYTQLDGIDVVELPDGGYAFICEPDDTVGVCVKLVRVSPNGNTLWERTYSHFQCGGAHRFLFRTADGGFVIVGGRGNSYAERDFYVVGVSPTGDSLWAQSLGTDIEDNLWNVTQTSDGGFLLVGYSRIDPDMGSYRMYLVRVGSPMSISDRDSEVPELNSLRSYPNPFNPATTISYSVPRAGIVGVKIYDVTGRQVETLVNGMMTAGEHDVVFDGSALPSGLYFAQLTAGDAAKTVKIVLLK